MSDEPTPPGEGIARVPGAQLRYRLAHLGLQRPMLVGHSHGGMMCALHAAHRVQQFVSRLAGPTS